LRPNFRNAWTHRIRATPPNIVPTMLCSKKINLIAKGYSVEQIREILKNENFSQIEERILKLWEKDASFIEGLPHYGHLLAGTIKDIVPRYWTMKGYNVPRRFGWDCHSKTQA